MKSVAFAIGVIVAAVVAGYIFSEMPHLSGPDARALVIGTTQVLAASTAVTIAVAIVGVELSTRRTIRHLRDALDWQVVGFLSLAVVALIASIALAGPIARPSLTLPFGRTVDRSSLVSSLLTLQVTVLSLIPWFLINLIALSPSSRVGKLHGAMLEGIRKCDPQVTVTALDDLQSMGSAALDGYDIVTARTIVASLGDLLEASRTQVPEDGREWPEVAALPFDMVTSALVRVAFDARANSRAPLLVIAEISRRSREMMASIDKDEGLFGEEDLKRLSFALRRLGRPGLAGDDVERHRQLVIAYMTLAEQAGRVPNTPALQYVSDLGTVMATLSAIDPEIIRVFLERVPDVAEAHLSETGSRRALNGLVRTLGSLHRSWSDADLLDTASLTTTWDAMATKGRIHEDARLVASCTFQMAGCMVRDMQNGRRENVESLARVLGELGESCAEWGSQVPAVVLRRLGWLVEQQGSEVPGVTEAAGRALFGAAAMMTQVGGMKEAVLDALKPVDRSIVDSWVACAVGLTDERGYKGAPYRLREIQASLS